MAKKIPLIGGHVSAGGGLYPAIERAEAIGATAIQIFGASPRTWKVYAPKPENIEKFKTALANSAVKSVFLHGAYVVNLASPDPESVQKSIQNLADHLAIAELIGAKGLIFHVGSGKEMPKAEAIQQAITAMREVLKLSPGTAQLIIENAAGGGQKIGSAIAEIAEMIQGVNSKRMAACFDTAHAFEAGLIESYTSESVASLCDEWELQIGLDRLVALHVNDSKTPFNSRNDRHENIGEGYIGLDGFKALAGEARLRDKSWLLEVPGFDDDGPDKRNVDILRALF